MRAYLNKIKMWPTKRKVIMSALLGVVIIMGIATPVVLNQNKLSVKDTDIVIRGDQAGMDYLTGPLRVAQRFVSNVDDAMSNLGWVPRTSPPKKLLPELEAEAKSIKNKQKEIKEDMIDYKRRPILFDDNGNQKGSIEEKDWRAYYQAARKIHLASSQMIAIVIDPTIELSTARDIWVSGIDPNVQKLRTIHRRITKQVKNYKQ